MKIKEGELILSVEDKARRCILSDPDSFMMTISFSYWKRCPTHSDLPKSKICWIVPRAHSEIEKARDNVREREKEETFQRKDTKCQLTFGETKRCLNFSKQPVLLSLSPVPNSSGISLLKISQMLLLLDIPALTRPTYF